MATVFHISYSLVNMIELSICTTPFQGRVDLLSLVLPMIEAMSACIKEQLDEGFIRNSSSPAGAEFFFL